MPMTLPRHAEIWLPGYLRSAATSMRESRSRRGVTDIMLAVVDHYEPLHGRALEATGLSRVDAWLKQYPVMAEPFLDADGVHPQHSFFFPIEEYRPAFLDRLAELCRAGFGEVEVHLHHDGDTAENLARQLRKFTTTLHERHGFLSRTHDQIRYGFVHGNWALDNALPDRRWCGVNGELAVLRDTGCYADFTNPAAPSPAQTRTVNQIYYASTTHAGPKAHDRGQRASVGRSPSRDTLLLVQGPLRPTWRGSRWRLRPRLETGTLQVGMPPTVGRFTDWLSCGVSVAGRPEWLFIKVHSHGAPEPNAATLLGPETVAFHRGLGAAFNDGTRFRLHYVTAREMVNIIHAAEDGMTGNPGLYRDYRLPPPPIRDGQATSRPVSRDGR